MVILKFSQKFQRLIGFLPKCAKILPRDFLIYVRILNSGVRRKYLSEFTVMAGLVEDRGQSPSDAGEFSKISKNALFSHIC